MYNSSHRDIIQLGKDKIKQQILNIFDMTTGRKQRLNVEEFTEYSLSHGTYIYLYTYIPHSWPLFDETCGDKDSIILHANNKLDKHGYRQTYKQSMT